jgi:3',5'-cyclic AMP phosphodiesterase CpdA
MRLLRNFFIATITIILPGCADVRPGLKIQASGQSNPWTHLNLYNNPDNFQFAIVADRTGDMRPGVFADAIEKLNLLRPEFVMSIGDLIEAETESQAELDRQWAEFDTLVRKLQMPFFYVPGNHDIGDGVTAEKWQERLGQAYYHFTYRNVLFLCLNTQDACDGCIGRQQLEYFRQVLETSRNVRWTLMFMHQPLWEEDEALEDWENIELLLADRPYTVFAGHRHIYNKSVRKGRRFYVLAITGGRGGGLDNEPLGLEECRFDHIAWVTMTEDGPVLANLLLEGILNDEPCPQ